MTAPLIHHAEPTALHTIVGDHARLTVAEHAKDADETRELGLMLGLFVEDTDGRLETVTPYDSHPNVLGGLVA